MGKIHQYLTLYGLEQTYQVFEDRRAVQAAATMMGIEHDPVDYTYSGFTMISLPHRKVRDQTWERETTRVKLVIEPGWLPDSRGNKVSYGLPYGLHPRLILIYLQTEAIRSGQRKISLGASMHDWLVRMGVKPGGTTYKCVRDQAARLSACQLTFIYTASDRAQVRFQRDHIVSGGQFLDPLIDPEQPRLWDDCVYLSGMFFNELTEHAVPISEEALRQLHGNSLALDAYIWLAYRLHCLTKSTVITWPALHYQFGSEARLRDFRRHFRATLSLAMAVYAQARVEEVEAGLRLFPSPPPVTRPTLRCALPHQGRA
jgi:hypothetical protein